MFSQNVFHENAKIDEPCTVSAKISATPCEPPHPHKILERKMNDAFRKKKMKVQLRKAVCFALYRGAFQDLYPDPEFALLSIIYPQTPGYGYRFFHKAKNKIFLVFHLHFFYENKKNRVCVFFSYTKTRTKQYKTVQKVEPFS